MRFFLSLATTDDGFAGWTVERIDRSNERSIVWCREFFLKKIRNHLTDDGTIASRRDGMRRMNVTGARGYGDGDDCVRD